MKLKFENNIKAKNWLGYTVTNENVAEYMPELCKGGAKSGLVICASGDQIICASMNGVNEIMGYDYNDGALYYTDLKLKALKNLEYGDFVKFVTNSPNKKDAFAREIYNEFKNELLPETREYCDDSYNRNDIRFGDTWEYGKFPIQFGGYMTDKDTYTRAQNAVENLDLTMIQSDLVELPRRVGKKHFDIGVLSNVIPLSGNVDGWMEKFDKEIAPIMKICDRVQVSYQKKESGERLYGFRDGITARGFGVRQITVSGTQGNLDTAMIASN